MDDKIPQTPPSAAPAPVVDRRAAPRGVIRRSAQTWLMVGLAIGILGIIAITGHPESPSKATTAPAQPTSTPSPSRLREYQDRLRLLEERARLETAVAPQESPTSQATPDRPETAPPADPLADEKRRREYESRFAKIVVLSRRPGAQVPALEQREVAAPRATEPEGVSTPPSLDAVAEAVVRASTRQPMPAPPMAASPAPAVVSQSPNARGANAATEGGIADRVTAGAGPAHRLAEGTVVETALWNKLNLTSEGPVVCRVTSPVYSHDLQHVLIPADALVIGESKPVGGADDEPLLAVTFHQLRMPNGAEYALKQASALNQEGDAGLHDQINRHYPTIFGAAGAIGLITGLAQAVGGLALSGSGGDRTVIVAGSTADASSQAATQSLTHFLNRRPTGTIRRGHRVIVYLTHDLDLPEYSGLRGVATATDRGTP
jgi:type IV secretory pathway VirB10-like protein